MKKYVYKKVKFNENIDVEYTYSRDEYDRYPARPERMSLTCTQKLLKQLNKFKLHEMQSHAQSVKNIQFH